jgi:hypothetical protein
LDEVGGLDELRKKKTAVFELYWLEMLGRDLAGGAGRPADRGATKAEAGYRNEDLRMGNARRGGWEVDE